MTELRPAVRRFARQRIWGFEPEDIEQELSVVLWKCYQNWDPSKKGFEGRSSSFYNYMVHAFQNMLGKLLYKSRTWNQSIDSYRCSECEEPVGERGKCEGCGNGRRKAVRGHITASLDRLLEIPRGLKLEDEKAISYDPLMSFGGLENLLAELGEDHQEEVLDAITAGKYLKKSTRERVRVLLDV